LPTDREQHPAHLPESRPCRGARWNENVLSSTVVHLERRRAPSSIAAALVWLCGGCELVVGSYEVQGGGPTAAAGGSTSTAVGAGGCGDLEVVGSWSFDGADPLEGLEPLGTPANSGEVLDGMLRFDFSQAQPGEAGRGYDLAPGATGASICSRARFDAVFSRGSLLISGVELFWSANVYCGFFLGVTNGGALQLFAIATQDGGPVDAEDLQGAIVAAGRWLDAELVIDGAQVRASLGGAELTLDLGAGGLEGCGSGPANGIARVAGQILAAEPVLLDVDDLFIGRASQ
jgi:hypothetical protein